MTRTFQIFIISILVLTIITTSVSVATCCAVSYLYNAATDKKTATEHTGKATTENATECDSEEVSTTSYVLNNTFTINGNEEKIASYIPTEECFFLDMLDKYGHFTCDIYGTDEVTEKMLTQRTEKRVIIERVIAVITDEKNGDARILNTDSKYNYISYKGSELPYKTGTVMLTYLMYNPKTTYTDDVIERYDYILDAHLEN